MVELPYCELEVATNGFSAEHEIGRGGSCLVYRGTLFGGPQALQGQQLLQLPPAAAEGDGEGGGDDDFTSPVGPAKTKAVAVKRMQKWEGREDQRDTAGAQGATAWDVVQFEVEMRALCKGTSLSMRSWTARSLT